jgi:CTP:molybdopterin cytidylyltransferase MocA
MKTTPCDNIAGIILAAGEGRRFGQCKALARLDGITFLEAVALRLKAIGCNPVIVVGGRYPDDILDEAERLKIDCVINTDWKQGQFTSLKTGLSHIGNDVCGVFITLVDHPFVVSETYGFMKEAFAKFPKKIIIPVHEHRRGHPIIIPQAIMRQIVESTNDTNLRDIIRNHEGIVVQFRCKDPGVLTDIDTREDLERARKA